MKYEIFYTCYIKLNMSSERGKVNHLVEMFNRDMAMSKATPELTKPRDPITSASSREIKDYVLDGDERLLVIEETGYAK